MQIVAITVAVALSLVAYSASTNLVGSWKSSLPDNAPNNLLFNIYEGEKEEKALEGLSIDIDPGKVTALVGVSGSGKTSWI